MTGSKSDKRAGGFLLEAAFKNGFLCLEPELQSLGRVKKSRLCHT